MGYIFGEFLNYFTFFWADFLISFIFSFPASPLSSPSIRANLRFSNFAFSSFSSRSLKAWRTTSLAEE